MISDRKLSPPYAWCALARHNAKFNDSQTWYKKSNYFAGSDYIPFSDTNFSNTISMICHRSSLMY